MKKIFIILFSLALIQRSFAQDSTTKKLDELLQAYHDVGKFNGSALVAQHGKILLQKGYGFKNIKTGTLNDENTIYQIASITKQFTATVVLKLIELNKLALTDKLSKFYPSLPFGDSITIQNLLTHTSGITDHAEDTSASPFNSTNEDKLLYFVKKHGLDFSPGSNWQYSNKGYQFLGYIIQKVSGISYYDAVKKYIFTPLKMSNSAFDFTNLVSNEKATGYWEFPLDSSAAPATLIDSSGPFSAGSIYSTVGDMYKWHRGLQSYKIVSKASLDKAYTPYKNHYGFGVSIDSSYNKRIIHHGGDIWGFKSDFARIVEDDDCVVLLNNIEDPDLGVTTHRLLAIICNQPYLMPAKNKVPLNDSALQKYAGSYEMQPGMVIEVTAENGHLMAMTDHKQELYAQENEVFIAESGDNQQQIRFGLDETGNVANLYFYKGGNKIVCKKVK